VKDAAPVLKEDKPSVADVAVPSMPAVPGEEPKLPRSMQPALASADASEPVPPPEWNVTSASRPWDFKFFLFLAALFIAANVGFVYFFSDASKGKGKLAHTVSLAPGKPEQMAPAAAAATATLPAPASPALPAPAAAPSPAAGDQSAPIAPMPPALPAAAASLALPDATSGKAWEKPQPPAEAPSPVAAAPAAMLPPAAPAPALEPPSGDAAGSAPAQDKVANQKELLSILDKD
jgi:hypothetical protein